MDSDPLKARVIVTYGRSLIALFIAQSLGRRGAEIIGCDDVNMTVLSFSKYTTKNEVYASPKKHPKKFITDIKRIIADNKPEDGRPYILIPSFYEARLLSEYADELEDDIILACPPFDAINAVDPKDHLIHTLQDIDVASPQSWLPQSKEDLRKIATDCNYPVFIKPPDGVGGRGISKIHNDAELQSAYADLKKQYPDKQIIVQEAAKGVDYCYCGLFDRGELVTSMVYHNTQKYPNKTGPGVVRETVDSKLFDPIAGALMKHVGWHGVCEIDFMWTENDEDTPMMIEVNPRFWSGLDHSIKSQLDFPYYLYQLFVEGEVHDYKTPDIGHKTKVPVLSNLSAIEAFMDSSVDFKKLESQWPAIKKHFKDFEFDTAIQLFQSSLDDSISLSQAYATFKTMTDQARDAEEINISDDDPFIGMGALFILGSLLKHGHLPPEIKR